MVPPPYPRTPHLWAPAPEVAGDRVLDLAERQHWLQRPVVVEEKLDGANVSVWWEQAQPQVASRGGAGAMDRARQLGPLRARVNAAYDQLRSLLDGGWVLYGEWLWLTHTVHYDRLPDHLVALDLWHPEWGFADLLRRDERTQVSGLAVPPRLFTGVLGSLEMLFGLMGRSRFGTAPMEGVVLRRDDGAICKVLRPGFVRAGDDQIGRARNVLTRRW
ncbi:MAG: RNA ligase family protein [Pseudonocardiaceae bacterium]